MALIQSTLKMNLYNDFIKMDKKSSEEDFADKISSDIDSYFKTISSNLIYTGVVPLGTIISGSGSIVSVITSSSKPIFKMGLIQMCKTMNKMSKGGDEYMINQLSSLISTFINTSQIKTNATIVWTSGMYGGTLFGNASGKVTSNPSILLSSLPSIFNKMKKMKYNGNNYLAEELSKLITNTLKTSSLTVYGEGSIIGSVGMGTIF